jgi:hypothetical protein
MKGYTVKISMPKRDDHELGSCITIDNVANPETISVPLAFPRGACALIMWTDDDGRERRRRLCATGNGFEVEER